MNLTSAAATFASLVNVASVENPQLKRVAPNDPTNSYIIHKLTGTDIGTANAKPAKASATEDRRKRRAAMVFPSVGATGTYSGSRSGNKSGKS